MWFNPRAKLAEISGQHPATPATTATNRDEPPPRVASVASVATPPRPKPQAAPPDAAGFPHGTACDMGLYPRTWTGRVVSLQAWRELTDWEKHGPRGGHWNAATGEWEGGGDG
jgi:hypothetical protein